MCKNEYKTTLNGSRTYYNAITEEMLFLHTKIGTSMLNEHIHFLKATFIQKHCNTLTCSELTFRMLFFNSFITTAYTSFST